MTIKSFFIIIGLVLLLIAIVHVDFKQHLAEENITLRIMGTEVELICEKVIRDSTTIYNCNKRL